VVQSYNKKIVISNPGLLPEGLSISDLYKEHDSKLRNPVIANVFYKAGYIDAWGRGILNILELLKKEELGVPKFEESANSFRIIFKRKATPQVRLTKLESKIIAEIKKDKKISRSQIARNLRIKPDIVKEYLNKLKDKRVLRRIGKTSGGIGL